MIAARGPVSRPASKLPNELELPRLTRPLVPLARDASPDVRPDVRPVVLVRDPRPEVSPDVRPDVTLLTAP